MRNKRERRFRGFERERERERERENVLGMKLWRTIGMR